MPSKTVVVIGDSLMSGVAGGVASQHALHLIAAERDVVFKNLSVPAQALGAVGGSGFHNNYMIDQLTNLDGYFGAGFSTIIIQAGTNDHGRNINWGHTHQSAVRILTYARQHGKKVLVLDPIWKEDEDVLNASGWALNVYRFFLHDATSQFTDVARFCHRENTVVGTSAGAVYFDPSEAPNRTHLTAAGQRKYADWIIAEAAAAGYF